MSVLLFLFFFSFDSSAKVELFPLSIRQGIEGYKKRSGSLSDPTLRMKNKVFKESFEMARRSNLDLNLFLDKKKMIGYAKKYFHFEFWNRAKDTECPREYLIQRVNRKKYYYKNGELVSSQMNYLVEVFKLKKDKSMKGGDRHRQNHSIIGYTKRKTVVDIEIGCGEIYGVAEGKEWPFKKQYLYEEVQDYSPQPGVYNKVKFDHSTKYSFESEFDDKGKFNYKLPYFFTVWD